MSKPSERINDEVVPVLNSGGAMNVPYAIDVRREVDSLHKRIEANKFEQDMKIAQLQDTIKYHFGFPKPAENKKNLDWCVHINIHNSSWGFLNHHGVDISDWVMCPICGIVRP